jgi:ribosome-associated protein
MESEWHRIDEIAQAIYDKKGANILAIDVREISTLTDTYIIAEGNVERHVAALAKAVVDQQELKEFAPYHIEGMRHADWVVIDYGSIIVHLLIPEQREKYDLETLWRFGKVIPLNLKTGKLDFAHFSGEYSRERQAQA